MSTGTHVGASYRVGEWLPSDHDALVAWIEKQADKAERLSAPLEPVLQDFKKLIESNAEIYMLFNQMFTQVPSKPPYNRNPAGKPQIRDYHQMLAVLNLILTHTPTYNDTGVVGFPINAILDWSMGTEAGYAAFLHPDVNSMLKKVLNEFGCFLKSPESQYAINEDPERGWLGANAIQAMVKMLPAVPGSGELNYWDRELTDSQATDVFIGTFECDPHADHWGFGCWDEFFTRTFRKGQRPVASPGDDHVIANACESAPYNLVRGAKEMDRFWIKGQPYSIRHMLDGDFVDHFVGGTIYQAFLSAKSYHCWNSPISGTVVKKRIVDGTYYSEIPSEGFYNPLHTGDTDESSQTPDLAGPNDSQGYISEVATRALIFIENSTVGLMCFMPIGMAEVSSCEIDVVEGQQIEKGAPIGRFHFGGSSHCLFFGPDIDLDFDLHGQAPSLSSHNIPVRDRIAVVRS